MTAFKAACVQLRSTDDVQDNIKCVSELIREAKRGGADFILTPENTTLMAPDGGAKLDRSFIEDRDPALPAFRTLAEELGIWLLIGSLAIKVSGDKTANRSFLINPRGVIAARYDKIHLFDVDLPSGEKYRESNTVAGGHEARLAQTPWGKIGMTICYDVRFPQLYRALAKQDAFALTVPSAFTETTGKAHWHVLLRARAIENGAYVLAPAQGGVHVNGRHTYGHSLIVNPWGEVIAEGGTEPRVIYADIDPAEAVAARTRIPNLQHDQSFEGPRSVDVPIAASREPNMPAMKLARVILFTAQIDTMSKFYGEVLGLKRVTNESKWREFAAGSTRIALHSGPPSPGRKGPKIVFYAKDVAAMREKLVAKGAKFGNVHEGEFCLCDGKDPDGNPIQLSNR